MFARNGMQDRMDADQEGCRTGGAYEKEMQDRMDAEQEGCRTGMTQNRSEAGWMQDRRDSGQE